VTSAFPRTTTRIDAPKTPPNWRPLLTTALPVALCSGGRSTVAEPMMVGAVKPKAEADHHPARQDGWGVVVDTVAERQDHKCLARSDDDGPGLFSTLRWQVASAFDLEPRRSATRDAGWSRVSARVAPHRPRVSSRCLRSRLLRGVQACEGWSHEENVARVIYFCVELEAFALTSGRQLATQSKRCRGSAEVSPTFTDG
jgi:hypothetical protein